MRRMGLLFGICAAISTFIGLVLFANSHDPRWPDQGKYEQHG